LIGFLGSDAESKNTKYGVPFTVLSLATKRSRKNAKGEWQWHTDRHRITCFGAAAEFAAGLRKGAHLHVTGYLRSREVAKPVTGKSKTSGATLKLWEIRAVRIANSTAPSKPILPPMYPPTISVPGSLKCLICLHLSFCLMYTHIAWRAALPAVTDKACGPAVHALPQDGVIRFNRTRTSGGLILMSLIERRSTEAAVAASRANSLKSPGPTTASGKLCSRMNALEHGMRAEVGVALPELHERAEDLGQLKWQLRSKFQPRNDFVKTSKTPEFTERSR
jgi:hypothetical protein